MAGGAIASHQKTTALPSDVVIPNSAYNIVVSFAAALGGFLFGYEIGKYP